MLTGFAHALLYDVTALFVIIDPPGTAAIFAAMTAHDSLLDRKSQAVRASAIALLVLLAFALLGTRLLQGLGIGLAALRVAGGILLFLAAADMVTGRGAIRGASDPERAVAIRTEEDISVFPLAIPLIAGPGAMTTVIVLRAQAESATSRVLALFAALVLTIGMTFACLQAARLVSRLLGDTGANVIGRVLGVLLAALAAQITLDGLHESFAGLMR